MSSCNADKAFSKEVLRFTLTTQKECLEGILSSVTDDSKTCGKVYRERITEKIAELNDRLAKCGGRGGARGSSTAAPRKLSAYNIFVKEQLTALVKNHPEMDNKARMTKVSEMWKALSEDDKARYRSAHS